MEGPCYRPGHEVHFIQWKHFEGDVASHRGARLLGVRPLGFVVELADGEIVEFDCIHAARAREPFGSAEGEVDVTVSERWHVLAMPMREEADGRCTRRIFSIRRASPEDGMTAS
jgi:hypothetical protein